MSQLVMLGMIIVTPYLALTLVNAFVPTLSLSQSLRGRTSLMIFFIFTGIGHFFLTEGMSQMLPPFVPGRVMIIYVTGVLEILGGVGLLIPRVSRLAALLLIVFLIGILPSNIYAAMIRLDFGGHVMGWVYLLVRVPFQLFVIGWAYYFGVRQQSEQPQVSQTAVATGS